MALRKTARADGRQSLTFRSSSLLTVVVGTEKEHFSVHEGIITPRSEFFRRAMNGNWAEKEERLIKLPGDDPEIFELYMNIVYTNQTPAILSGEAKDPDSIGGENSRLCQLYVLCEKLCDTAARDKTMEAILAAKATPATDGNTYLFCANVVAIVYAGTPANSAPRKLALDMWRGIKPDYLAEHADALPKDFFVEFAQALLADRVARCRVKRTRNSVLDEWKEITEQDKILNEQRTTRRRL